MQGLTVFAAAPGTLAAMQTMVLSGTLYNGFHQRRGEHVAVLGTGAARQLGIVNVATQPAVFINDTAFTVVGIISDTQRLPETLLGILIPSSTAESPYGPPDPYTSQGGGAHMLIRTRVGAADQIAREAPLVLDPAHSDRLHATAPPDPHSLRDAVNTDLSGLFLLLAGICLIIGAVGIANTTFVAVLERTGEIGLRRALGARRRHIATQFLTESTTLGTFGGLLGTSLGVCVVLAVALVRHWTALLDPATVIPAPLFGSAAGLAAGLYPAIRAASIEPLEALRR